jgi:hypothetical protein
MRNFVLRRYATDEMSKFKDFKDLQSFVGSLKPRHIRLFAKLLSKWRKNGVYKKIMQKTDWHIATVDISQIFINGLSIDIRPIIEENGCLLANICGNQKVSNHKEFKSQGKINRKLFLAERKGDMFQIIDGNHRIIRLACDGDFNEDTSFMLMFSTEGDIRLITKIKNWILEKLKLYNPYTMIVKWRK